MVVSDAISRRNKILEIVVDSYVSTAAPVGSLAVSKKFRERLSPATIRNIMAELEEIGYITHPHTSAGRIPTDKGYRYYVDSIMEPRQLTPDEKEFVEVVLNQEAYELGDLIKRAGKIISELTGQASLVSFPRAKRRTFKRIELIPATKTKIYTLLFTAQGLVKHSIFEAHDSIEESELLSMSHILDESDERVLLEGAHHIIEQPEFREAEKVMGLLKALEGEEEILSIMEQDLNEERARIHIGAENPFDDIKDCSIVISNYRIGSQNIGSIGVIGPTRMDYSRAVPAVEYVSNS